MIKGISVFLLVVILVNFGIASFAYGDLKSAEADKIRFNREVLGGVVGGTITEIIGALIVGKLILSAPASDEYGIGNWLTFSALYYLSSILIFIPLGSATGVTILGRLNEYESDWWQTLKGSYDGIGYGLGVIPIVLYTSPFNSAKAFEKNARRIKLSTSIERYEIYSVKEKAN